MKHTFLITILFVFAIGCSKPGNPDEKVWIKLFNGRDLSDWDIKISGRDLNDNFGNTFHVEDSLLKVSYTQYDSFRSQYGHINSVLND